LVEEENNLEKEPKKLDENQKEATKSGFTEETTKSGFVAVLGRPNAGKSSLLNALVGEHLAMVSSKQNATRKRMNIIVMHKNAQIIFVDTPGLHESEKLLNKFMIEEAIKALGDSDLLLFLAPVTDSLKNYEKFLELNKKNIPHILLLTKVDQVSNDELLKKIQEYQKYQDRFLELLPISITKGINLTTLLDTIIKYLPRSPYYYDPEFLTTSNIKDIYKEYIREAIFEKTSKEIPYFSDVVIEQISEEDNIDKITASIIVEKKSQKGIMIGKDGQTIKRIGKFAREKIEALSGKKAFLKLFVKVKPRWSKEKKYLRELGYDF